MKKLEEIPKNDFFKVPDGYFENLPTRIQSRISTGSAVQHSVFFAYKLHYILPVILAGILAFTFWLSGPQTENDSESLLASVETSDLIAYLNDSEITTEDVIENVDFDSNDVEDIEQEVYDPHLDGLEKLEIDELELENM